MSAKLLLAHSTACCCCCHVSPHKASHTRRCRSRSDRTVRAMDAVDLTQVANQLGTAVLKASSGVVVKATGELAGPEGEAKLATLLQLLQVCNAAKKLFNIVHSPWYQHSWLVSQVCMFSPASIELPNLTYACATIACFRYRTLERYCVRIL
jgi:hypothetical protein